MSSSQSIPDYDSAAEFVRIARENNHGVVNIIAPNTGTELWFIEFCKSKKPSEVINLIAGFTHDLPATTVAAETVNKILQYHATGIVAAYKYVHALCPMVHDRWNLNKDKCIGGSLGGVVDCYWRNFGDLNYKPQMIEFTKLVLSAITSGLVFGIHQTKTSHDDGIWCSLYGCESRGKLIINSGFWCTQCKNAYHVQCFDKINEEKEENTWIDNLGIHQRRLECPACHIPWDLKNHSSQNKGYQKW